IKSGYIGRCIMPRLLACIAITVVFCASASFGQAVCTRSSGTPIDMQVQLSFDNRENLPGDTNTPGMASAGNDPSHGAGTTGAERQEFSPNMQIRVELQDNFGARLQELQPSSEGKSTFRVCNRADYR